MNSEEMERAIQFILQQQAQFWAAVESLKEVTREHSNQRGRLGDRIDQLTGHVGGLTDLVMRLGRIIEEQGRRMDRTDEHLNALIATVDRYISRHNGDH